MELSGHILDTKAVLWREGGLLSAIILLILLVHHRQLVNGLVPLHHRLQQ